MPRVTAAGDDLATAVIGDILRKAAEERSEVAARYSRNPFAHCEDGHIWIEDLESGLIVPLDPWDQQRELTEAWIDLDLLAETGRLRFRNVHERKSRQLGMTWWVAYLCWWAITHHSVSLLCVFPSIADASDSGFTTDSFFGRIKFMNDYGTNENDQGGLPDHLRPILDFTGGNDPSVRNQPQRSYIAAGGAQPSPGRGKRYDAGFIDEFAYHPFGRQVHKSLSRSIPNGRLYNSTPFGEDNTYWWLYKVRPRGYRFLRHHWSEHEVYGVGKHTAALVEETDDGRRIVVSKGLAGCPQCQGVIDGKTWTPEDPAAHRYPGRLTSPWFEQAIVEMTDEDVASELEIDPTAALSAKVYAEFNEAKHVAAVEIPWDPNLKTEFCIDYGADTTAGLICQDAPREYRIIGEFEMHDTMPEEVANAIRAELRALGVPELMLGPDWTRQMLGVGDPAGEARQQATGRPLTADYRALGFTIHSRPRPIALTIRAVKRLLMNRPKPLVVSARCKNCVTHFKSNRWPVDRNGDRKAGATEPQNDEHNHMMRALAYLITWKFPPPSRKELPKPDDRRGRSSDGVLSVDRRTGRIDPDIGYETQF